MPSRVVYLLKMDDDIWVVHAFQKKSKTGIATPKQEIDLVRERIKRLKRHWHEDLPAGLDLLDGLAIVGCDQLFLVGEGLHHVGPRQRQVFVPHMCPTVALPKIGAYFIYKSLFNRGNDGG